MILHDNECGKNIHNSSFQGDVWLLVPILPAGKLTNGLQIWIQCRIWNVSGSCGNEDPRKGIMLFGRENNYQTGISIHGATICGDCFMWNIQHDWMIASVEADFQSEINSLMQSLREFIFREKLAHV
mgnify:CR=1 FL=1